MNAQTGQDQKVKHYIPLLLILFWGSCLGFVLPLEATSLGYIGIYLDTFLYILGAPVWYYSTPEGHLPGIHLDTFGYILGFLFGILLNLEATSLETHTAAAMPHAMSC